MDNTSKEEQNRVSVWLEDTEQPTVGKESVLSVEILSPGAEANWGESEVLNLLINLTGFGCETTPGSHLLDIRKDSARSTLKFSIKPEQSGTIKLRLSFYHARTLTLLEEYEVTVQVRERGKKVRERRTRKRS